MTVLHVVGQNGDKELATFLFENGELTPYSKRLRCYVGFVHSYGMVLLLLHTRYLCPPGIIW